MKRFGTKSGLVRIYDKFNHIENILDSEGKANFESAEDNLQDLATYAIMMLPFKKKKVTNGAELTVRELLQKRDVNDGDTQRADGRIYLISITII